MLNLKSKCGKLLICISIGISLGLFLFTIMLFGDLATMPFSIAGLVAFVIVILWFLKERKKIGFGAVASIFTVVVMPIATIPLNFIYGESLGIFLQTGTFRGLALLFLGSGVLAIGLIGVYIEKNPKKLGLFFMSLSLIFFLVILPFKGYEVLVRRWDTWIFTPYEEYTIPLILVGVAFLLLGSISFLYSKSWQMGIRLIDAKQIKQISIDQLIKEYGTEWGAAGKNIVIDGPALKIIKRSKIPTFVLNGKKVVEIKKAINNENFNGTIIKI